MMSLYAVCFEESIVEEKLISVVEAQSEEEAIHHHFRKYMCVGECMRQIIVSPNYEDFFFSYFEEFEEFEQVFSATPSLVQFMDETFSIYEESQEKKGSVPMSLIIERAKLLTNEMCIAVANFLIENNDINSNAGDVIVTEVEIETA